MPSGVFLPPTHTPATTLTSGGPRYTRVEEHTHATSTHTFAHIFVNTDRSACERRRGHVERVKEKGGKGEEKGKNKEREEW